MLSFLVRIDYFLSASAVGIIALLIKTLMMLGYAWDFYEKHFVWKGLRRLLLLRKSFAGDASLIEYLDGTIRLETFRMVSGTRASALKASALMTLSNLGLWDVAQIRLISRCLVVRPDNPVPKIEINFGLKLSAWSGLLLGGFMIALGALGAIFLLLKGPIYEFFIGMAIFIPMVFFGGWLATDFGRYRITRQVQEYLKKNPETFGARK